MNSLDCYFIQNFDLQEEKSSDKFVETNNYNDIIMRKSIKFFFYILTIAACLAGSELRQAKRRTQERIRERKIIVCGIMNVNRCKKKL